MSKNVISDEAGDYHWKTREYTTNIGTLTVNYNRGSKYVVWYDFDEDGPQRRMKFKKKKDLKEFLNKVKAELVNEYYD